MTFNSLNELEDKIIECNLREIEITDTLKKYYNKLNTYPLFDPNKKIIKKEIKDLKNKLKTINKIRNKCNNIFTDLTTFDTITLLKFLTKYISIIEKEDYVLLDNIEIEDYRLIPTGKTIIPYFDTETYHIITTKSNSELLKDNETESWFTDSVSDDIDEYLSVIKDNKYICIEDYKELFILNNGKLDEDFRKYPYIEKVGYQIVDLKLKNPELDDETILNTILNNTNIIKKRLK